MGLGLGLGLGRGRGKGRARARGTRGTARGFGQGGSRRPGGRCCCLPIMVFLKYLPQMKMKKLNGCRETPTVGR